MPDLRSAANRLTACRLLALPLLVALHLRGSDTAGFLLLASLALSDWLDGRIARAQNRATTAGFYLDIWADFIACATIFAVLALEGNMSASVFLLSVACFASFLARSRAVKQSSKSLFGKHVGAVCYLAILLRFAVAAFPALHPLEPHILGPSILQGVLLFSLTVAILENLWLMAGMKGQFHRGNQRRTTLIDQSSDM